MGVACHVAKADGRGVSRGKGGSKGGLAWLYGGGMRTHTDETSEQEFYSTLVVENPGEQVLDPLSIRLGEAFLQHRLGLSLGIGERAADKSGLTELRLGLIGKGYPVGKGLGAGVCGIRLPDLVKL